MNSELEKMENKRDNWQIATIMLAVCLLVSVGINFSQDDYAKKRIAFAEMVCKDQKNMIIEKLVVEKDMLATAVNNVYMFNIKAYPEAMQKMIIAAKDGKKIDFDFYLRKMQEEHSQQLQK